MLLLIVNYSSITNYDTFVKFMVTDETTLYIYLLSSATKTLILTATMET